MEGNIAEESIQGLSYTCSASFHFHSAPLHPEYWNSQSDEEWLIFFSFQSQWRLRRPRWCWLTSPFVFLAADFRLGAFRLALGAWLMIERWMGGQWDESLDGGGRIAVWLRLLHCGDSGDFLRPSHFWAIWFISRAVIVWFPQVQILLCLTGTSPCLPSPRTASGVHAARNYLPANGSASIDKQPPDRIFPL